MNFDFVFGVFNVVFWLQSPRALSILTWTDTKPRKTLAMKDNFTLHNCELMLNQRMWLNIKTFLLLMILQVSFSRQLVTVLAL